MFCRIFTFAAIGLWAGAWPPLNPRPCFRIRSTASSARAGAGSVSTKAAWQIKEGALEIRVEPGVAHNVKNSLVRSVLLIATRGDLPPR